MSCSALAQISVVLRDPRPVSINRLYSSNGSRRFLTKEGRKFKAALRAAVAEKVMLSSVPWPSVVDYVYKQGCWCRLDIHLYIESLYNRSWKMGGSMTTPRKRDDGTTPKSQQRSPYQRVDGSNYVKLIEDAVKDGTGIDDSCFLYGSVYKREDREDPRIEITFSVYE